VHNNQIWSHIIKVNMEDKSIPKPQEISDNEQEPDEEYRVWKKNVPFLYDLMITKALEWPSLTVQWMPFKDIPNDSEFSVQKLILGTHTSDQEQNYLMIAKVRLPLPIEKNNKEEERSHYKGPQEKKIEFEVQICHEGEVNRARFCPQEPQLIATKAISGEVHLFNYYKHPSIPIDSKCVPDARLVGHSKEGYGLSWNQNKKGYIVSSSDDGSICVWDVSNGVLNGNRISPLSKYSFHKNVVNDVCWHKFHNSMFGSVDDDKRFAIWDIRKENKSPIFVKEAHKAEINCLDFNPLNEFLLGTGSKDKTACIWDMRNLSNPISTLGYQQENVYIKFRSTYCHGLLMIQLY